MTNGTFVALAFAFALGVSAPASAVPLNVVESGDFAGGSFTDPFSAFTAIGTLDVGVNMVSGQIERGDHDVIAFDLPTGLQIDIIDLIVTNHFDSTMGATSVRGALDDPFTAVDLTDNGMVRFPIAPLEGPESLKLLARHNGLIPNARSDWKFNITVSQVPEPITLGLMGLGLLAYGLRRRRKM